MAMAWSLFVMALIRVPGPRVWLCLVMTLAKTSSVVGVRSRSRMTGS